MIYRFKVAFDLAWGCLSDFLEYNGLQVVVSSPDTILRDAYAAGALSDRQVWIDMLVHRNSLGDTYDRTVPNLLVEVQEKYVYAIRELSQFLKGHHINDPTNSRVIPP